MYYIDMVCKKDINLNLHSLIYRSVGGYDKGRVLYSYRDSHLRILSYKKPSLSYLDGYLDIAQYSCKPYDDVLRDIKPGNIYKFSIEATPSRTKITRSFIEDPNDQIQWILHRDISNGFMINEMNPLIPVSHRTTKINEDTGTSFVMKGVFYSGVLTVVDKDLFTRALCQGLGHGKAWGFGLIHIDKI